MSCPTEEHMDAVRRIFRYVKGTIDFKLVLGGSMESMMLKGFSDADWGANDTTRKSISGYCFTLGAGAITWSSKKQKSVALSSTEAEYMALTQAVKEAIWLNRLLEDLDHKASGGVPILVDNQSCIALAKNPEFHSRTKHIDIQYHFIREKVELGVINLEYCPTKQMVADVLTKGVTKDKHQWCTKAMGVRPYFPAA
jgi:hypothetical protein